MSEMEQTADHVVIIGRGRLIADAVDAGGDARASAAGRCGCGRPEADDLAPSARADTPRAVERTGPDESRSSGMPAAEVGAAAHAIGATGAPPRRGRAVAGGRLPPPHRGQRGAPRSQPEPVGATADGAPMSAATRRPRRRPPAVGAPAPSCTPAAAEWSRLWSVRSTWLVRPRDRRRGARHRRLVATDAAGDPADVPGEVGGWDVGAVRVDVHPLRDPRPAVVTTTGDHATGGIVPSLQWTPRRGILLTARTLVVVGTTSLYGAAARDGSRAILVYTVRARRSG